MTDVLAGVFGIGVVFIYHQLANTQPPRRVMADGEAAVELVLGGTGMIDEAGDWHQVGTGSLLWSGPGEATIGRSDPRDPYVCLALRLRTAPGWARPLPRRSRWQGPPPADEFARLAVAWWLDARIDRDLLCRHLVAALAFAAHAGAVDPALPDGIRRLEQAIEAGYREDLPVEALARAAGWSVQHLHAQCRGRFGCGPHALLLRRRIRAARELLAGTVLGVEEVARSCGFPDATALCRAFRRECGLSPGRWRGEVRLDG